MIQLEPFIYSAKLGINFSYHSVKVLCMKKLEGLRRQHIERNKKKCDRLSQVINEEVGERWPYGTLLRHPKINHTTI